MSEYPATDWDSSGPAEKTAPPSPGSSVQPEADSASVTQSFHGLSSTDTHPPLARSASRPTIPGYEILGELGRGGMGVIYKARQAMLQRLVALKMILAGSHADAEDLARFLTEAEALARLQHPHIVQVHEIGEHEGLPFLSLEYCGGTSLAKKIGGTPLPPLEAARLLEALASATGAAHQHGVIHRDLKPGNILFLEDGTPKITDFGLAKKLDDVSQTKSGTVLGTPSYMAPEQACGKVKAVGPAADIYSLGAILYECLTGRPPFRAATSMDTVYQVLTEEPVPPRQLQSKTPRDLETICLKCLHKEPHRRYTTASELAEDLRRFQAGEPILARPTGHLERGWRWCRRNPRLALLSASVVLLLVIIAGGASVAALLLQHERDQVLSHQISLQQINAQLLEAQQEEKKAREDAVEKLWKSYLAQARAGRWSGQPGRRFGGLEVLAKAAAIKPTLELRNEAIACMALVDLGPGKEWAGFPPGTVYLAFNPSLSRYARCDARGNISVRLVEDDSELLRLEGVGCRAWHIQFDAHSRFLVGKFHPPGANDANRVILWDLRNGKRILDIFQSLGSFAFRPDGQVLAIGYPDNTVRFFETASGKETGMRLNTGSAPQYLSFHPAGDRLAISGQAVGVKILDTGTGKLLKMLAPGKFFRGLAWHPHGKLLAGSGNDTRVYLWNTETGETHAALDGHQNAVLNVSFNPSGTLLVSIGWEGMIWLWDPWGSKLLLRVPGVNMFPFPGPTFSADGRQLGANIQGGKIRLWDVANAPEFRTLYPGTKVINREVALSPDGDFLACPEIDGVRLWSLPDHQLVAHLPGSLTYSVFFEPNGKGLLASGHSGLQRWPVLQNGKGVDGAWKFGPAQVLGTGFHAQAALSQDGKILAALVGGGKVRIYDLHQPNLTPILLNHPNVRYVTISPKGDFVATGTWHGTDIKIWDAQTGKVVKTFAIPASAGAGFSPDGQWFSARSGIEGRLWKVGTWQPGPWLYQDRETDIPSNVAFAPQGDLLALNDPLNLVRLLDPATGQELATLEPLRQQNIEGLCFDATGNRLAVATDALVQVWDLALLRLRLKHLKLDWGH